MTQPIPTSSDPREVHLFVAADIEKRAAVGKSKYGQTLRPHNGRSSLQDAYEEALDLAMYLKQRILEEES